MSLDETTVIGGKSFRHVTIESHSVLPQARWAALTAESPTESGTQDNLIEQGVIHPGEVVEVLLPWQPVLIRIRDGVSDTVEQWL